MISKSFTATWTFLTIGANALVGCSGTSKPATTAADFVFTNGKVRHRDGL